MYAIRSYYAKFGASENLGQSSFSNMFNTAGGKQSTLQGQLQSIEQKHQSQSQLQLITRSQSQTQTQSQFQLQAQTQTQRQAQAQRQAQKP